MVAASIVQEEKRLKTRFFLNQLVFNKEVEVDLGRNIAERKKTLTQIARLCADSGKISRAEFSMLCMKFQRHPELVECTKFIDSLIGRKFDFDIGNALELDKSSGQEGSLFYNSLKQFN